MRDWTHEAHIRVACWHVSRLGRARAAAIMPVGIKRLNASLGVLDAPESGYHETITVAFLHLVEYELASLRNECNGESFDEKANAVAERLADKRVLLRYYSRECIMSADAKQGWIEPDLKPLPNPNELRVTRILFESGRDSVA
jgi:hypothetical protein